MGIAALILGIISAILGFIPFCGIIAFLPAVVGLILGIIDVINKKKKGESKGVGIAGIVLSALAIVIISLWLFVFSAVGSAVSNIDINELSSGIESFSNKIEDYNYNNYDME